jgi:hypothetical protein
VVFPLIISTHCRAFSAPLFCNIKTMTSLAVANKLNRLTTFFADAFSESFDASPHSSESNLSLGMKFKKIKRIVRRSKYGPIAVVLIVVVLVLSAFLYKNFTSNEASGPVASITSKSDGRVKLKKPSAVFDINKQFLFPLNDANGKEVSKLKFNVENAELRNEIVVSGERATSIVGRTFLVINIKIVNDYEKAIQINVRDYLRLIVDGSKEKLAPEVHNDPVEVQAISTKYTRVAFPINDNFKTLVLQVGEITKDKQDIKLNLK